MRFYNFSAGPAMLPEAVLKTVKNELLDYGNAHASVMEISHRGPDFMTLAKQAEVGLRELLAIPDNYKVLFTQGGASAQFSAVPINLLTNKTSANYVHTGHWSKKSIVEAKRYCKVNICTNSTANNYTDIADFSSWDIDTSGAYLHYTPNETIAGLEFDYVPDVDMPVVADMSSTILSRPLDVAKFGVIYAGAQKNIGPAGLTIVIVRDDLIGKALPRQPILLDYKTQASNNSMYNTPPAFAWYVAGLVFKWLQKQGGLQAVAAKNKAKADLLYNTVDNNDFYSNPVAKKYRSLMNVPFILSNDKLDELFLKQSFDAGLLALKGHRSVGGMRASIYNAMPISGVEALVEFMIDFASKHG